MSTGQVWAFVLMDFAYNGAACIGLTHKGNKDVKTVAANDAGDDGAGRALLWLCGASVDRRYHPSRGKSLAQ